MLSRDVASELTESGELSADELDEALGMRPRRQRLLLGFYTASGMEHALYRYGIFEHLERLDIASSASRSTRAGSASASVYGEAEARSICSWSSSSSAGAC